MKTKISMNLSVIFFTAICVLCICCSANISGAVEIHSAGTISEIRGMNIGDRFGRSISVGDINNDNFDDIVIGAVGADPGDKNEAGEVYIVFGDGKGMGNLDVKNNYSNVICISGQNEYELLGSSIAVGDINNDSCDDVIIGAMWGGQSYREKAGEVYIIFGSKDMPSSIDLSSDYNNIVKLSGHNPNDLFGCSVAVGNVNNDDFNDIIVGARGGKNTGGVSSGEAYIIFGRERFPSIIDISRENDRIVRIRGESDGDFFGQSVCLADVNRDGYSDVVIGAPFSDPNGRINAGCAYIILGRKNFNKIIDFSGSPSNTFRILGAASGGLLGESLCSGDVNNDKYYDIIIGAPMSDAGGKHNAGEIFVIFGRGKFDNYLDLSNTNNRYVSIIGAYSGDSLGESLCSGDYNNDGLDDIIIGAPFGTPDKGKEYAGKVFVVYGRRNLHSSSRIDLFKENDYMMKISGDIAGDHIGISLALGDLNGDKASDLLVGSSSADHSGLKNCGISYVIWGESVSETDTRVSERPVEIPIYVPTQIQVITKTFSDSSGNDILRGGESGEIRLTIKNTGRGIARNIKADVQTIETIANLEFSRQETMNSLAPNESKTLSIPVEADENIGERTVTFRIELSWGSGERLTSPVNLLVRTRTYAPPEVVFMGREIRDSNGNNVTVIRPGIETRVDVTLKNEGSGTASGMIAEFGHGDNISLVNQSDRIIKLPDIGTEQYYELSYTFIAGADAVTQLPLWVTLTETNGHILTKDLKLRLNEPILPLGETHFGSSTRNIELELYNIDFVIDKGFRNPDGVAVVIGNRNYSSSAIDSVAFALYDAEIMITYLEKVFGFPSHQIIKRNDATADNFRMIFGEEDHTQSVLYGIVEPGITDLFVYYSGHGAYDPDKKKSFLCPVDIWDDTPNSLDQSGYPISLLYNNLESLKPRSLVVVLESCFSGYDNMSPIILDPTDNFYYRKNAVSFSSSKQDQYSYWLPHRNHGLFTYFFLKAIREVVNSIPEEAVDVSVTANDIFNILSDEGSGVPFWTRHIYGGNNQDF
ncbi:hypothetical protein ES708_05975 [subsurface metagenome]